MCVLTKLLLLSILYVQFGLAKIVVVHKDCAKIQLAYENHIHPTTTCQFVSTEHIDCPIFSSKTAVFSFSLDQMFTGLVSRYQNLAFCDKIMIFVPDFQTFRYFIQNKKLEGSIAPFTRIVVYTKQQEKIEGLFEREKNEILNNGLYMNFAIILNETHYQMEDVLNQEITIFSKPTDLDGYVMNRRTYQRHPLFTMQKKNFNVSLFDCPPHVIRLDDRMIMDSYDGSEMRLLREITRGWTVNIFDRSFMNDAIDNYEQVTNDVETRRTMMGMCSMWLFEHNYRRVDVSQYFSHHCGTFLVPKPKPISEASYLYLPMSTSLWWWVLVALFVTSLLYFFMNQLSINGHTQTSVFENFGRAFMDIFAIATSHGLPVIGGRLHIRLLVISWILLCFLLGTAYNAKFKSLMTIPLFTKAVDNVEDFLNEGGMI